MKTSGPWQRLSARLRGDQPERTLHTGVPGHLEQPLRNWIYTAVAYRGAMQVALRLGIQMSLARTDGDPARYLAGETQHDELLDIIDAILSLGGPWIAPTDMDEIYGQPADPRRKAGLLGSLSEILTLGDSAYRISASGESLTTLVDPTIEAAVSAAVSTAQSNSEAGSAAEILAEAWAEILRLHPQPDVAYSLAIKAVESAVHAVVQPAHKGATLGTMLGELRSNPGLYRIAIPGPDGTGDIAPVIALAETLWQGQTSRHGGKDPIRLETVEEARMAVEIAVTLTRWFSGGGITRTKAHKKRAGKSA